MNIPEDVLNWYQHFLSNSPWDHIPVIRQVANDASLLVFLLIFGAFRNHYFCQVPNAWL